MSLVVIKSPMGGFKSSVVIGSPLCGDRLACMIWFGDTCVSLSDARCSDLTPSFTAVEQCVLDKVFSTWNFQ